MVGQRRLGCNHAAARFREVIRLSGAGTWPALAADFLLGQGFVGTVSVKGGTGAWVRSRRPVETD